jgi:hypothetical protein
MDKDTIATIKRMISNGILNKKVAEEYFPELKETETIRDWIIDDLKDSISTGTMPKEYQEKAREAIEWLNGQTVEWTHEDTFWWQKVIERYNRLVFDVKPGALDEETQRKDLFDELTWINNICKKVCRK